MKQQRNGRWELGGTHSSPTALGLGISAPHPPQIGTGGAQKCFILRDQTTGDLKSHHLQAGSHSQPCPCPHGHLFSAELWVIRYHLGNLCCILCITVYTRNII